MLAYFAPRGNHVVFSTQRRKGAEKQSFLIACGAFWERGDWEVGEFYLYFHFCQWCSLGVFIILRPRPNPKKTLRLRLSAFSALKTNHPASSYVFAFAEAKARISETASSTVMMSERRQRSYDDAAPQVLPV